MIKKKKTQQQMFWKDFTEKKKRYFSKDLKKVKKSAMLISWGRVSRYRRKRTQNP